MAVNDNKEHWTKIIPADTPTLAEDVVMIFDRLPMDEQLTLAVFCARLNPKFVLYPAVKGWIERHKTTIAMISRMADKNK